MKQREKHVWTWPIAGYLFLGGLGAGVSIVVAAADLFFGLGSVLYLCLLVAIAALALGSFLLIFELGRPLQFWRVFSKQKAVLTFGAWMVSALIVFDIIYLSCFISWFPWEGIAVLRVILSALCLIIGCGVLMYTGIELSSMKGRLLWNTPILPILFALSGLLTGIAACLLCVGLWAEAISPATLTLLYAVMRSLGIGLTVVVLITSFIYVLMIYTSSNKSARNAMKRWLSGTFAPGFWGGLIVVGLVLPLLLFALDTVMFDMIASVFIICGGLCLRFLVVYSDDRQLLSGEGYYWDHLAKGNEPFLDRNWG